MAFVIQNNGSIWGKIGKIFLTLFILAIIAGLVYIGYIWYTSGQISHYTKAASISIDNQNPDKGLKVWWDSITNPAKMKTYNSVIDKNENNDALGVKINKFEPIQTAYFQGNDIRTVASVYVSSLTPTTLLFNCTMQDFYDSNGPIIQPTSLVYMGKGSNVGQTVFCIFKNDKISYSSSKLDTKTLTFDLNFDYLSRAYYKVYVMRKSVYENIVYEKQQEPFDYYGVNEPLLQLDKTIKSKTIPGPVNLGIGNGVSQPYTEGESLIPLQVSLTPSDSSGNILFVRDVTLKVTPEIELVTDPNSCDFELKGEEFDNETGEKLYNLYKLTPNAYNRINIYCTKEQLNGTGLTQNRCVNDFKTSLQLLCFFKIPEFPQEESDFVLLSPIIAEADYVYQIEKKAYVDIRKTEISSSDACTSYTMEECPKTGCQVVTINNEEKCVRSS